ncbi:MAG: hypothetical protein JXQ27_18555 [Acidobacteria bacterium]|nr:hypothetical protein [Acidobacteriota bacterium]
MHRILAVLLGLSVLLTAVPAQSVAKVAPSRAQRRKKARIVITDRDLKTRPRTDMTGTVRDWWQAKPVSTAEQKSIQRLQKEFRALLTERAKRETVLKNKQAKLRSLERVVVHRGSRVAALRQAREQIREMEDQIRNIDKRMSDLQSEARKLRIPPVIFRQARKDWERDRK